MTPTLSPLTFEELRHLIEWPAALIYGDLIPVATAEVDRDWHKLESQYRTLSSDTPVNTDPNWRMPDPFDPPTKDIRSTRELLDWEKRRVEPTPEYGGLAAPPEGLVSTIARPNTAAYFRSQLQSFRPNPHKKSEFEADYTDYAEQDGIGVIDGAAWVLDAASQVFFNTNLFSRSTIELLTPAGAGQTLRGHAARENAPESIQSVMQSIYQQHEDLRLSDLRSLMLNEIQRWQDIGRSAVIGPDDEIDQVISLVNAETAAIVISKLLEKLRHLNGFVVGAESTLS